MWQTINFSTITLLARQRLKIIAKLQISCHRRVGFFMAALIAMTVATKAQSKAKFSAHVKNWKKKVAAPYYLPVEVHTGGFARRNKVVSIDLNFTKYLNALQSSRPFARNSLRVVEVSDIRGIIDPNVPFQFETVGGFEPAKRAVGSLMFMLVGQTSAHATRRYRLYFGGKGPNYKLPSVEPRVKVTKVDDYEGDSAFKVRTPVATYYYHIHGSGFASLIDSEGHDWISYHPRGGPKGSYRGIPNIAPAGFHPGPGKNNKASKILSRGPLRVSVQSESKGGEWSIRWDIDPRSARMTLLKKSSAPYWILYEGTPGGQFTMSDHWVNSAGQRFDSLRQYRGPGNAWSGNLPIPEWVYFGDQTASQVLFLAHYPPSNAADKYWNFDKGEMTVFGFGRGPKSNRWQRLSQVPAHLTIGFAEGGSFKKISKIVNGAYRPVQLSVGTPQQIKGKTKGKIYE